MAERKISAAQFFISMFVSRVVVTIALNAQYTGGENMLDSMVSYVLAMALGFVIALPVWGLHRRRPGLDHKPRLFRRPGDGGACRGSPLRGLEGH